MPVLLDLPSNLDNSDGLNGIESQDLNNMLLGVIENKIIGHESFDDGHSQRVGMHIYLVLVLLSAFTQTRADIIA
jgi:hypothetical protein